MVPVDAQIASGPLEGVESSQAPARYSARTDSRAV
jgi:hypothetical protein